MNQKPEPRKEQPTPLVCTKELFNDVKLPGKMCVQGAAGLMHVMGLLAWSCASPCWDQGLSMSSYVVPPYHGTWLQTRPSVHGIGNCLALETQTQHNMQLSTQSWPAILGCQGRPAVICRTSTSVASDACGQSAACDCQHVMPMSAWVLGFKCTWSGMRCLRSSEAPSSEHLVPGSYLPHPLA